MSVTASEHKITGICAAFRETTKLISVSCWVSAISRPILHVKEHPRWETAWVGTRLKKNRRTLSPESYLKKKKLPAQRWSDSSSSASPGHATQSVRSRWGWWTPPSAAATPSGPHSFSSRSTLLVSGDWRWGRTAERGLESVFQFHTGISSVWEILRRLRWERSPQCHVRCLKMATWCALSIWWIESSSVPVCSQSLHVVLKCLTLKDCPWQFSQAKTSWQTSAITSGQKNRYKQTHKQTQQNPGLHMTCFTMTLLTVDHELMTTEGHNFWGSTTWSLMRRTVLCLWNYSLCRPIDLPTPNRSGWHCYRDLWIKCIYSFEKSLPRKKWSSKSWEAKDFFCGG